MYVCWCFYLAAGSVRAHVLSPPQSCLSTSKPAGRSCIFSICKSAGYLHLHASIRMAGIRPVVWINKKIVLFNTPWSQLTRILVSLLLSTNISSGAFSCWGFLWVFYVPQPSMQLCFSISFIGIGVLYIINNPLPYNDKAGACSLYIEHASWRKLNTINRMKT